MNTFNQIVKIKLPKGNVVSAKFIQQDERGIWVRLFNFHNTEVCVQKLEK